MEGPPFIFKVWKHVVINLIIRVIKEKNKNW